MSRKQINENLIKKILYLPGQLKISYLEMPRFLDGLGFSLSNREGFFLLIFMKFFLKESKYFCYFYSWPNTICAFLFYFIIFWWYWDLCIFFEDSKQTFRIITSLVLMTLKGYRVFCIYWDQVSEGVCVWVCVHT
jgi:hypothetical protein